MLSKLCIHYQSAINILSGMFPINTGNLATTVAANLAAFLPVIGSQLSSAINFTSNWITNKQINIQAKYIKSLAVNTT